MADLTQAEAERLADRQRAPAMRRSQFTVDQIDKHSAALGELRTKVLKAAATGDTLETIGAALTLPVGTIKSNLNRGRSKLAKLVAEDARKWQEAYGR